MCIRIFTNFLIFLFFIFISEASETSKKLTAEEIMATADERIEKIRKEDAVIKVTYDGKPAAEARVEVEQISHEFLFGSNIFMWGNMGDEKLEKAYRDQYAGLLNYATLPFYWWMYEPEKGKPRHAQTMEVAKWCKEYGITTKGHPLVWNYEDPSWLPNNVDEIQKLQLERVSDCVSQFKGLNNIWDVVNEAADFEGKKDKKLTEAWLKAGRIPLCIEAFKAAWEANPKAILLINDFELSSKYEDVIKQLVDDKGKRLYDVIGIQSHMHSGAWDTEKIWEVCEQFSKFNVPLHFTETTILSGRLGWDQTILWDSTPEGEKYQAENVEHFYTVLFSHPAVEAITWWDFCDKGSWMGAPAGFIRADGTPKPAYDALKKLVKGKWWTKTEGKTDEKGVFKYRGFLGKYRIKVYYAHQIITADIELKKGEKNEFTITVPVNVDH
jgi:endo-1,4-beta-xylanase